MTLIHVDVLGRQKMRCCYNIEFVTHKTINVNLKHIFCSSKTKEIDLSNVSDNNINVKWLLLMNIVLGIHELKIHLFLK